MYVINLTDKPLKYNSKGVKVVLEPQVVTLISDELATPKKLRDCYGSRIDIIDEDKIREMYTTYSNDAKPAEPSEPVVIVEPEETKDPEGLGDDGSNEDEGTKDDGNELGVKEPEIVNPEPEIKTPEPKKPTQKANKAGKSNKGSKKTGKKN